MAREVSAGGVVVRALEGVLELAVIRPRGRDLLALPKGHVDPGEDAQSAALREVLEETGLQVSLEAKLGDVHYVYQRAGVKIFKVVTFFLLRYRDGVIDKLEPSMRVEVDEAKWIPLSEAPTRLAYRGEREMAKKALETLTVVSARRLR